MAPGRRTECVPTGDGEKRWGNFGMRLEPPAEPECMGKGSLPGPQETSAPRGEAAGGNARGQGGDQEAPEPPERQRRCTLGKMPHRGCGRRKKALRRHLRQSAAIAMLFRQRIAAGTAGDFGSGGRGGWRECPRTGRGSRGTGTAGAAAQMHPRKDAAPELREAQTET